jgi:hypothetical protein
MALSPWAALAAGALLQLQPAAEPSLGRDDLAVIHSALSATALADMRRGGADGELLVLDETVVLCSSTHHLEVACMREGVDLPSAERTLVPLRVPPREIADTRTVAHGAVEDVFRSATPDMAWTGFHNTFPNAAGFAGVSAPAYDDSGTARVYVTFKYGSLGAKGWLVHLSRDRNGWRVTAVQLLWIS